MFFGTIERWNEWDSARVLDARSLSLAVPALGDCGGGGSGTLQMGTTLEGRPATKFLEAHRCREVAVYSLGFLPLGYRGLKGR